MPEETAAAAVEEQIPAESAPPEEQDGSAAQSAAAETSETKAKSGEGEQPQKKGGVQKRIDELTREKYRLEVERDFYREKAEGKKPETKQPDAKAAEPPKEPQPDDFGTYEEYVKALARHEADQRWAQKEAEQKQKEAESEQQTERQKLAQQWKEKEATVAEKHADYDDVKLAGFESLREAGTHAAHAMADAISVSDSGPELLYYLGAHPEEAKELAKLHPLVAIKELGKIEARLAGTSPAEAKPIPPQTKAPQPPRLPAKRSGGAVDDGELRDDLPIEEWQRRFDKRRAMHEKG